MRGEGVGVLNVLERRMPSKWHWLRHLCLDWWRSLGWWRTLDWWRLSSLSSIGYSLGCPMSEFGLACDPTSQDASHPGTLWWRLSSFSRWSLDWWSPCSCLHRQGAYVLWVLCELHAKQTTTSLAHSTPRWESRWLPWRGRRSPCHWLMCKSHANIFAIASG